jgi:DEAD/DEAH box helicase domain-containing protein
MLTYSGRSYTFSLFFHNRGVKSLYTHQAAALRRVFNGSNIVAATPTASGKSMTYIIPVCLLEKLVLDLNNLSLLFSVYHV